MPLLRSATGEVVSLPDNEAGAAIARGYEPVDVGNAGLGAFDRPETGALGGAFAGATGLLSGATLGLSDVVGSQFASPGQRDWVQQAREQHPITTGTSQIVGALLPSLGVPGSALASTPAAATSSLGRSIVEHALPQEAGALSKAAVHAASAGAEGALYGGGEYLSQTALEDKPLSAEGFLGAMGKGALFAAPIGGALSLGESTLLRARSLFPKSEVTAAAAKGIDREATTALTQAIGDGDAMAAAVQRKIALTDAKIGMAQSGESVTRAMFGDAHPQALGDQVTGAVDKSTMTEALQKYQASKAQLADWIRTEADPELESALRGLGAPDIQGAAPGVPVGEFGAPGAPGIRRGLELVPREPTGVEVPVLDSTRSLRGGAIGTPVEAANANVNAELQDALSGRLRSTDATNPGRKVAGGAGGDLEALLRGTKSKLDEGQSLSSISAESPARKAYVVGKQLDRGLPLGEGAPREMIAGIGKGPVAPKSAEPLSNEEFDKFKNDFRQASKDTHYSAGMYYSKNGDVEINGALREGRVPHPDDAKAIANLDDALAQPEAALQRDTTLYRGLSGKWAQEHFAEMKPGQVFEDPGYLSTAHNADSKVRNEDVVFNIHTPAGVRGIPISSKYSSEREILLGRGTKLRIDSNELVPQIPTDTRWNSSIGHEVHPDKSVTIEFKGGSKHTYPPIRELNVTIVSEHAPPPKIERLTDEQLLSGPLDQFSQKQLRQHQDAMTRRMDAQGRKGPEYEQLGKRWDEAVGHLISDAPRPSVDYRIPIAPTAGAEPDLMALLKGTKSKLDEGASIGDIAAGRTPAVGETLPRLPEPPPAPPGGPKDLMRLLGIEPTVPAIEPPIATGVPKTKIEPEMHAQMRGAAADAKIEAALARARGEAPKGEIGKTIVDSGMKGRVRQMTDDEAIAKLLGKRVGKNVDVGPALGRAAKAISAYEGASADLVEILGGDAPVMATQNAKAFRAATRAQADTSAASSAKAIDDINNKVMPAVAQATGGKAASAVGALTTLGSAMEVLHALGAHVPSLAAIPVIGPVLSLFLKAKAVMGIIGRKGGSIGRTTEGLVAAKSAATRDRLATATKQILEGGARAAGKAAAMAAGPAAILGFKLFPGGEDPKSKDPQVLFAARSSDIDRALQPGAIEHAIGDRYQTSDPHLLDAIVAQTRRGIEFLDSKRPKPSTLPGMLPGDGKWAPSTAAIAEFARYVHAVNDPASVLEDLAKGHVTLEGAETLRKVYPALFSEAQRTLLESAAKLQKTLPYPLRVAISIMYQVPIDGTMTPRHLNFLQPPAMPGMGPAPAGASGPGASLPPPALTGVLHLGQQTMTSLDRRAGM